MLRTTANRLKLCWTLAPICASHVLPLNLCQRAKHANFCKYMVIFQKTPRSFNNTHILNVFLQLSNTLNHLGVFFFVRFTIENTVLVFQISTIFGDSDS